MLEETRRAVETAEGVGGRGGGITFGSARDMSATGAESVDELVLLSEFGPCRAADGGLSDVGSSVDP